MVCRTCRGAGNIMSHGMPLEWFRCPGCDGNGARFQFGPAEIVIRAFKPKKPRR